MPECALGDEVVILVEAEQPLHCFVIVFKVKACLFVKACCSDVMINYLVVAGNCD